MQRLNVRCNIFSADHPKSDGQSENMICTLSFMFCNAVQFSPSELKRLSFTLKFEDSALCHNSTYLDQFEVILGYIF